MSKLLLCKKHRWRFQIQSWAKEVRHKAIDYMEGLWFLPYRVVFKKYFIWLHWALVASLGIFSCSIRDVVPWPGFKPRCSVLGVGSHSHWATREAPRLSFFNWKLRHERLKKYSCWGSWADDGYVMSCVGLWGAVNIIFLHPVCGHRDMFLLRKLIELVLICLLLCTIQ